MNGFEKRRSSIREKILEATLELFARQGIKKTSIKQISDRAEVSPVTIYNYFESKSGLVREVVKYLAGRKLAEAEELFSSGRPYLERLAEMVFIKNQNFNRYHPELLQAISAPDDPALKEYVNGVIYNQALEVFTRFLEEGKRLGYIRAGLSAKSIRIFTEMFRYLSDSYPQVFEDLSRNHELVNEIWKLYLYGLMGQESHPELFSLDKDRHFNTRG
ncbi:MAG: TetR/AcrR family transcriptional regulator [Dehalococcoidaceae bacterium]|nr:TetR/AcrR family transcriptional regulator [Dehalococcoidaceae bacterium]